MNADDVRAADEQRAAAERKRAVEKERALLEQSGVTLTPSAEVAPPAAGSGTRVRTVKTTAKDSAFAACKADERLIGGGCNARQPVSGNYPSGQGAEDTVGARWNCSGAGSTDVTAYALCTKLP